MNREKIKILQTEINPIDYEETLSFVEHWIQQKKRPAACIVQANVFSLVNAKEDKLYRKILYETDLVVPDGMPLVWFLKGKGIDIKDRVYGPDLMLRMCNLANERSWRVFLYGGKSDVVEKLKRKLHEVFPKLRIVGNYSPPFRNLTQQEDDEICQLINSVDPDILWVGLGGVKQDIWMHEHKNRIDVSIIHGVGAAFDFISGQIPQSPRWMMRVGLEWAFRLCVEPKRLWKRYTIANIKFLFYICLSLFNKKPRENE